MVTPVLVTRGDVPMDEILESVRVLGVPVVWDNSSEVDLGIWGQYCAAMSRVETEYVYFQDDDVLTDPAAIAAQREPGVVVCNMPEAHRSKHAGQPDSLVGFGCVFERALIERTFAPYVATYGIDALLRREAPRIFTSLNRVKWIDVPKRDLPWATAANRMYHQPEHGAMRDEARRRCRLLLGSEAKCA